MLPLGNQQLAHEKKQHILSGMVMLETLELANYAIKEVVGFCFWFMPTVDIIGKPTIRRKSGTLCAMVIRESL